ncbi:MAG: sulfite exporter TauE/SafE family protein [Xanthomonadales bacterium]|nr:sulfite exporter TauE/SafE family protein [Xanthomonadales bacterium]
MWIEFGLVGILAGFLAGYLGIGGGIIVVPALIWLFSKDPQTMQVASQMAVATSLATMLLTSLSSLIAHHRKGAVAWPVVQLLAPGLLAGAIGGAILATVFSSRGLAIAFGVFALLAGLQMIIGRTFASHKALPGRIFGAFTGVIMGAISSLVGIGGGSMTVPWMLWHGRAARDAVATAAACGYPIAIGGTLSFMVLGEKAGAAGGYINWAAFAGIAVFSIFSAPIGAAVVHKSRPATIKRIFGLFLILIGLRLIWA